MIKHLFLDLEDTIITPVLNGWANIELMNVQEIRKIMGEVKPDQVSIFSFAIWNKVEAAQFDAHVKNQIERVLGVQLQLVPVVDDDIIPACCREMKLHPSTVSFRDLCDFWGKQGAFKMYVRSMFKAGGVDVTLVDDAVFNEEFSWPDIGISGRIINIEQRTGVTQRPPVSPGPWAM